VKIVERVQLSETTLKVGIGIVSVIMMIGLVLLVIGIDSPIESLFPVWLIVLVLLIEALKEEKSKKNKENIQEKNSE
jgi:hypothetical protein